MGNSNSSGGCCGTKPKDPYQFDHKSNFQTETPIIQNPEEHFIMSTMNDYLGVTQIYCQQIYDAFRPYILRLGHECGEDVNLTETEYLECLSLLNLIECEE